MIDSNNYTQTSNVKNIPSNKPSTYILRVLTGFIIGIVLVILSSLIYFDESAFLMLILFLLGLVGFPVFMYKTDKDVVR